jgi:tetratricopeptide (TPR) repeat protein
MLAGEYEEAARELEIHNRLEPQVSVAYAALMFNYTRLEQFDMARAVADKAVALRIDGPPVHRALLALAYQRDDRLAVDTESQWFDGRPDAFLAVAMAASSEKAHGRRRRAADLLQHAADLARQQNRPADAARLQAPDALTDALLGNCSTARSHTPGTSDPVAMALCGETATAQKTAENTSRVMANSTLWNLVGLPTARAAIAIAENQPAQAIDALRPAARYERGQTNVIYLRGLAYLKLGQGSAAAAEFQKIVRRKGESWESAVLPLSYLGLARAAILNGDPTRARHGYEEFFAFWRDADPDIPVVVEAQNEYEKLKST